jgi:hypothetical protein
MLRVGQRWRCCQPAECISRSNHAGGGARAAHERSDSAAAANALVVNTLRRVSIVFGIFFSFSYLRQSPSLPGFPEIELGRSKRRRYLWHFAAAIRGPIEFTNT